MQYVSIMKASTSSKQGPKLPENRITTTSSESLPLQNSSTKILAMIPPRHLPVCDPPLLSAVTSLTWNSWTSHCLDQFEATGWVSAFCALFRFEPDSSWQSVSRCLYHQSGSLWLTLSNKGHAKPTPKSIKPTASNREAHWEIRNHF